MKTPDECIALIKQMEGLRLKSYLCSAGIPTIGYGATGKNIILGMTCSVAWAEARLVKDLAAFTAGVARLCPGLATASEHKQTAVIDFAYNLGLTRLAASTFRKQINNANWGAAAMECRKWVHAAGRRNKGLIRRRNIEANLLLS